MKSLTFIVNLALLSLVLMCHGFLFSNAEDYFDDASVNDVVDDYGEDGYGMGGLGGMEGMGGMGDMSPEMLQQMMGGMGDMSPEMLQQMMAGMGGGMGGGYGGYGEPQPPPFDEINSMEDFEDFIHHSADETEVGGGVLGLFDIPESEEEAYDENPNFAAAEAFIEAARTLGPLGYRFGLSTNPEVLEHFKVTGAKIYTYLPPFFVSSAHERPRKRFPGSKNIQSASLVNFIKSNSLPLVGRVTPDTEMVYVSQEKPVVAVLSDVEKNSKTASAASQLRDVALDYKNDALFALIDRNQAGIMKQFRLDSLGISEDKIVADEFKLAVVFNFLEGKIYMAKKSEKTEDIKAFVDSVLSEEYSKDLLNVIDMPDPPVDDYYQDAGDDEFEDNVESVDTGALKNLMENAGTNILVEFYAPWCGYCKGFAPDYSKVADDLSSDSLAVVKMNGDVSEIPAEFDVQGFPTLYFVHKDRQAKPVAYDGELNYDDVVKFVQNQLEVTDKEL